MIRSVGGYDPGRFQLPVPGWKPEQIIDSVAGLVGRYGRYGITQHDGLLTEELNLRTAGPGIEIAAYEGRIGRFL